MAGAVAAVTVLVATLFGPLSGSFGVGATFSGLVAGLVALLIVWHAWKWPQPHEVASSQQRHERALR